MRRDTLSMSAFLVIPAIAAAGVWIVRRLPDRWSYIVHDIALLLVSSKLVDDGVSSLL